jgi:hypothetical protein
MGTTTFSGPIKAGTIKETTGTTLGTDVQNTGFVQMVQSKSVSTIGATANTTVATIPGNSQITNVTLDVIIVNNDGTAATVSVGTAANGTAFIAATDAQTIARTQPITAAIPNLFVIGTSDIDVIAVFAATDGDGTTGEAIVTVQYVQNNNVT